MYELMEKQVLPVALEEYKDNLLLAEHLIMPYERKFTIRCEGG